MDHGHSSSLPRGGRTHRPVVLAVGPLPPPISGMTKAFELVAKGLPGYGWDVRVVNISDSSQRRPNGSFSIRRVHSVATALLETGRALPSADVMYLTIAQSRLGFAKDILLIRLAQLMGRPVVIHMHGGNFGNFFQALTPLEQRLVRSTLDAIFRVIVLTPSLKGDFSMTRDWSRRAVAISNAAEGTLGEARRMTAGRLRILYLSNLVVAKGYRDLVLGVGELARRRPELRLHLDLAGAITPERDFPNVEAQRADLTDLFAGLPASVEARFHGTVQGDEKARLFREADVFVLPTWYVNEGQPIVLLEALSAGLPVVATDWRGIRESLPISMGELLIPARSPTAIAAHLEMLLEDPGRYQAWSRDAISHAVNFLPARHLAAIDDVLRQAMSADGGAAENRPPAVT